MKCRSFVATKRQVRLRQLASMGAKMMATHSIQGRRPLPIRLLLCVLAWQTLQFGEKVNAADRPDIVLILVDDLGYSDLGCYGGEIRTPNLDELARNGLRFTQFYNTARCWPTRAAMLTGYYAQQVRRDAVPGVSWNGRRARPYWAPLLSVMLREAGYRTYHSGKWHIDGKPLQNGFDRSFSFAQQNQYFRPDTVTVDDQPVSPTDFGAEYFLTSAIVDHALECLSDHVEHHREQPYFEYLAFTAPHFPLHALPEDIARYRDAYVDGWEQLRSRRWERMQRLGIGGTVLSGVERDLGPPYDFPGTFETLGPHEVRLPLEWESLSEQQRRFQATKMALHAAMVDRVDQEVGRVLNRIREMGRWNDTLILFLSDNGASAEIMVRGDGHDPNAEPGSAETYLCLGPGWSTVCNTPFRRHKTWVHEGGTATPLIIHWPGGIESRGELRHTPGHVIDLVPTILELAAVVPEQYRTAERPLPPGKSLVPALKRDVTIERDYLWWLHDGHRALRQGDWKIVSLKGQPWELYDLSEDRSESKNLALVHPGRVERMARLWQQHLEDTVQLAR